MSEEKGLIAGDTASRVREFEDTYGFGFDDFQSRACAALDEGSSVLVAAPTGAGKTVVGEFAAWLALKGGGKTFYTTPIKALSNQKYGDFVLLHGAPNVGLLTGDNSINGDAQVVVMTTEVLRNMIYEDSEALDSLQYVVLDEVHYLQDPYRGAVWEEVLIHLPVDVQIVSLSATVSNAEEFAEWLQTLRGRTEVIIEERRPVEVRHWYFAADELLPMFVQRPDGEVTPNPRGREFDRRRRRGAERPGRGGRRTRQRRARTPYRSDVVERLDSEGMLPAIYFIFSRKGCDDAVRFCLMDNVRLTTPDERARIIEYAESRVTELAPDELDVLGFNEWLAGLANGIAAHHAGLIPPFKETVEELFKNSLVKVVFATETLALGINMPARTVVIENLIKFTGERHELMTPGEYTQLSGRAGRRGIDDIGHSVVLFQKITPFDTITRLASTRTYPLNSSFQVSYNMAANLVRTYDRHDAEHLVNSSFAQFQADRDVVQLERTRERSEAYLASYRERMLCDLGDFDAYRSLVSKLNKIEDRRGGAGRVERVTAAIESLRAGDVIEIRHGKKRGRYAVLETAQRRSERSPHVLAVSELAKGSLAAVARRLGARRAFARRRSRAGLEGRTADPPPAGDASMSHLPRARKTHALRTPCHPVRARDRGPRTAHQSPHGNACPALRNRAIDTRRPRIRHGMGADRQGTALDRHLQRIGSARGRGDRARAFRRARSGGAGDGVVCNRLRSSGAGCPSTPAHADAGYEPSLRARDQALGRHQGRRGRARCGADARAGPRLHRPRLPVGRGSPSGTRPGRRRRPRRFRPLDQTTSGSAAPDRRDRPAARAAVKGPRLDRLAAPWRSGLLVPRGLGVATPSARLTKARSIHELFTV
jgi:superfamily II DNA/RNA helicase